MKTLTHALLSLLFLTSCSHINNKPSSSGTFRDERDGQTYKWVRIRHQIWMAQNLNYETTTGCWSYNNAKHNRAIYGLLYDFSVVKAACPKGWHIPSEEEWQELEVAVGMSKDEASATGMYRGSIAENLILGGSSGFEVRFGGKHGPGGFSEIGERANIWSSTRIRNPIYTRIFSIGEKRVGRNAIGTAYGLSIRCIKDSE